MTETIHIKELQVRGVDVDQSGRIQPIVFIDHLLDAAGEHAALGGAAVTDLFKKGLTWVLSRLHVRFRSYPAWGRTVTIRTWPSGRQGIFAIRDFEVTAASGPVAEATSSWIIVDLKTRRPTRVDEHIKDFPLLEKRTVDDDFAALPAPAGRDGEKTFPVFYYDLDMNRHVTSTVYIHRALESVPPEVLFKLRPSRIEVNFRGEAFHGDAILSRVERAEDGPEPIFLHRLSRAQDDKELTLLRTRWADFKS
jgi:acyl-ACP thioesterase